MPRAGVAVSPGWSASAAAGLSQRLGKRLERRQWLLGTAADQHGCVFGESGLTRTAGRGASCRFPARPRSARSDGRGASARLPTTHEAARAQHGARRTPSRYARVRTAGGGTGAGSPRRRSSISARVSREGAIPSCVRNSLGELSSGGERCAAIAARREPLDQPAIGRLRQRVERHLRPGQADRLARVARPQPPPAPAPRRAAVSARRAPRSPTPRRTPRESGRCMPPAPGRDRLHRAPAANARTSTTRSAPSSATASRVAIRCPAAGPSACRSSVSATRRLAARRFVEHVGPEPRGKPALADGRRG